MFHFKIKLLGILLFIGSSIPAQSRQRWDTDTIQDSLLSIQIESLVDWKLWRVDPFETENDFVDNWYSKKIFKEFYMQSICYRKSELIQFEKNNKVYSYSEIAIIVAPKNRRFLLRTILFCYGVKFNSYKGKQNCLIITREPNKNANAQNFNAESIKLSKSLLTYLK